MKAKKTIFIICRLLVGFLFIFSGAVKAIDPLGSVYKITDYMVAMGLDSLTEFGWIAYVGAFALFTIEFTIGVCLVTNMNFKLGLWGATLMMAVMTPLTVWIAMENPVTDCGCFGDAIVMTNVQTLIKNIIIDAFIILMWIMRKVNHNWKMTALSWIVTILAILLSVVFGMWTLKNIPVVDFRPYYVGADIRKQMEQPEGTHPDIYETSFVYTKNGVTKEFKLTELPEDINTWEFVEQKTKLVERGVQPPVHDFMITNIDGDDLTDEVLDNEGKTYLVVMWDLNKTDTTAELFEAINQLQDSVVAEGATFMGITASDDITLSRFIEKTDVKFEMWFMDPIQLKTMVRANPGIFVIEKGIVVEKYNANKLLKELKREL